MVIRRHGNSVLAAACLSNHSMTCNTTRAAIVSGAVRPKRGSQFVPLTSKRLKPTMSSPSQNQLWSPGSGIRFSPRPKAQPLYPSLDMTRFIHTPEPEAVDDSLFEDHDMEYFSDDEQFERDIVEWLDQNESLLAPYPPVEDSPKPQTKIADNSDVAPVVEKKPVKEAVKEILPPVTSLDYAISNELFQAALKSKPESPGSYWSHTMYRHTQEDGTVQNVKVHYCQNKGDMENICNRHFLNEKVIGFDLEWMTVPSARKSARECVSLIQIASPSRIGLFHVAVFPKDDFVGPIFRQIMESEAISKVGVNIKGDFTRLRNHLGIEAKGVFELSHLYKLVKYYKTGEINRINKVCVAMAKQVQDVLRLPLYKGDSVRTSNWMRSLSLSQIKYAASDAYAGVQLYFALEYEREQLNPRPPRPEFSEKNLPIRVAPVEEVDTDAEVDVSKDASEDVTESDTFTSEVEAIAPEPSKPNDKTKGPDPRIADADLKVKEYILKKRQIAATSNAIRIYFLWHDNEDLSPESITKVVPLRTSTVVSYILDAICREDLPYPKQRARNEILSFLAPSRVLPHKGLMEEFTQLQNTARSKE